MFLNSPMASYVSGELLRVDYACTAEEVAGINQPLTPIDMTVVLGQTKKAGQKK